ncbi:unnamed protein product, partial [Iphiclides podalirius]
MSRVERALAAASADRLDSDRTRAVFPRRRRLRASCNSDMDMTEQRERVNRATLHSPLASAAARHRRLPRDCTPCRRATTALVPCKHAVGIVELSSSRQFRRLRKVSVELNTLAS